MRVFLSGLSWCVCCSPTRWPLFSLLLFSPLCPSTLLADSSPRYYTHHTRETHPHLLLAGRNDLRGGPHLPGGERDGRRREFEYFASWKGDLGSGSCTR